MLGLGPVTLVGQSMGANTAMLTAARWPELVSRLVTIEGSPDGPEPPTPEPAVADEIRQSLARWPVPFASGHDARRFFENKGLDPDAWVEGLQPRIAELPGSHLRTIQGADHDVHLDAPDSWVRALTDP